MAIVHKTGSAAYKTYVAKLTQTVVSTSSGLLVIGKTYVIDTLAGGDDFANVGYVALSTPFVATGTTPTVWANSTVVINATDSAPVATILENTIGSIVWSYDAIGVYSATLAGQFLLAKTALFITPYTSYQVTMEFERMSDDALRIRTVDTSAGFTLTNELLYNTTVEIRVYA